MTGERRTETVDSQDVLNMHWPADPAAFPIHDPGLAVRVRLVWEHDGETFIEGWAIKWDASHVYVAVEDHRLDRSGVWVKPHDVYRRHPTLIMRGRVEPDF
ncbi:hypothetical protein [Phytoactinopolyspora limicola]|uniref:hypothetical protein n=1 Tax=Phytoactinopolyspora limicola TaxID=2715536 RepID=UPI00140E2FDB|nr:hypothetical protein [Phytoactinopolyspora limicola]